MGSKKLEIPLNYPEEPRVEFPQTEGFLILRKDSQQKSLPIITTQFRGRTPLNLVPPSFIPL